MQAIDTYGIILAGGAGSRMYPMTSSVSKQLLPVYDKPLIYYPMATLMAGGIKKVLVISQNQNIPLYHNLFKDGKQWGMDIKYTTQDEPHGIAEAFTIGADIGFLGGATNVALILGDNIFHGNGLPELVNTVAATGEPTIFVTEVSDPQRYGVAKFDDEGALETIIEKPQHPPSNMAVTGLYFYPVGSVVQICRELAPSDRGELEITDVNKVYLKDRQLRVSRLSRGVAWLDTGTPTSLLQAAQYVQTIQERQGRMVACLEEIALQNGWIDWKQLFNLAENLPDNEYSTYLSQLVIDVAENL